MPETRWDLDGGRSLTLGGRVLVMGIVNATPDSFYDGGRYLDPGAAVERGLEQAADGADIVDIGGESTRPPMYGEVRDVPAAEEARRVVPVVAGLRRQSGVAISVDTTKAEVAARALDAGADMVNDVSALGDPQMGRVVATAGAACILMHRRGTPATMQLDTHYDDLVGEVTAYLRDRAATAVDLGIPAGRLAVDPGVGFGKSVKGNHILIRNVEAFAALGFPVFLGTSRKSFIWKPLGLTAEDALEGSLAAAALGAAYGADALRVHDVAATVRALGVAEAIAAAPLEPAGTAAARG
jgi:dihydropteroate synthase